tara:strand:+ start:282 stop:650 length:369 start_codon:yes stop_codon:yes gene_type:complete
MIKKYRKKPIIVEAQQWDGTAERGITIESWAMDGSIECHTSFDQPPSLFCKTLEGNMYASPGDFIIRGIQGEFYPCKPDIFAATYEEVPDTTDCDAWGLLHGRVHVDLGSPRPANVQEDKDV